MSPKNNSGTRVTRPSYLLNLDFPVSTWNPDLFRARAAGIFPIHRATDHAPHLVKPPAGTGGAPPTPRRLGAPISDVGVDAEFELFVVHIYPFIFDGIVAGGVGQRLSKPKEKREYVLNANRPERAENNRLRLLSSIRSNLFCYGFLRIFPNSPSTGSISIRPLSWWTCDLAFFSTTLGVLAVMAGSAGATGSDSAGSPSGGSAF